MGNVRGTGGAAQPLPDRREGRRSRAGPEARRARAKPVQGREAAPAASMGRESKRPRQGGRDHDPVYFASSAKCLMR